VHFETIGVQEVRRRFVQRSEKSNSIRSDRHRCQRASARKGESTARAPARSEVSETRQASREWHDCGGHTECHRSRNEGTIFSRNQAQAPIRLYCSQGRQEIEQTPLRTSKLSRWSEIYDRHITRPF
jgi:hypothetical protein